MTSHLGEIVRGASWTAAEQNFCDQPVPWPYPCWHSRSARGRNGRLCIAADGLVPQQDHILINPINLSLPWTKPTAAFSITRHRGERVGRHQSRDSFDLAKAQAQNSSRGADGAHPSMA
jgi:hypothetical protein